MARRRLSAAHKAAISRSLRRKLGPTTGLDSYVPKGKSGRAKPKAVEPKPTPAKKAPAKAAVPVPAKKTPAKKVAAKKTAAQRAEAAKRAAARKTPAKKAPPKKASALASDFVWEDEPPKKAPETLSERRERITQQLADALIEDTEQELHIADLERRGELPTPEERLIQAVASMDAQNLDSEWADLNAPAQAPAKRDFKTAQEFVEDLIDDLKHESAGRNSPEGRLLRAMRDVHEVDYLTLANAAWDGVSVDAVLDELDRHGGEPENTSELITLFSGGSLPERSISVSDVLDSIGGWQPPPKRDYREVDDIGRGIPLAEMTADEAINHQPAKERPDADPKPPPGNTAIFHTHSPDMWDSYADAFREAGLFLNVEEAKEVSEAFEEMWAEAWEFDDDYADTTRADQLSESLEGLRQRLIREGTFDEPMITFPYHVVDSILSDGRFRNGVELGASNGHEGLREVFEDNLMGADSGEQQRPIFGSFRRGAKDDAANLFGEFRAILAPHKAQEATFTIGDSFMSHSIPYRVDRVHSLGDEEMLALLPGHARQRLAFNPGSGAASVVDDESYIEAQFHNGVSVDDIDHVEIDAEAFEASNRIYRDGVKAATEKLRAAGIRVVINNRDRYYEWLDTEPADGW